MKKFFIALMGGTVLLMGVVLLFLPGPGALVIAAGFAILATEFIWARKVWRQTKGMAAKARRKSGLRDWWRRRRGKKLKSPTLPPVPPPETKSDNQAVATSGCTQGDR